MRERATILIATLGVMLAACGGGSGSTGLVTSEDAVIDHVRATGSCGEFDGAPYCATDSPNATAPGGERVSVVSPAPTATAGATSIPTAVETPVPSAVGTTTPTEEATSLPTAVGTPVPSGTAEFGTATPQGAPTSTPSGAPEATETATAPTPARTATAPAGSATPAPVPTATPAAGRTVTAVVDGFPSGAACATAARSAGSADDWRTAALVPLAASGATTFPLPSEVAAPLDATLLCFDDPPAALPPTLATLTDAEPTVVFVLPSVAE